ncbi:MAG: hypothetical protein CM1200mP18_04630 [Gammaproteobacteria bacterium]|nr:MAG: hypothetical protein CM1200mP18_04630 [Gammaproteobacteria bacterium]
MCILSGFYREPLKSLTIFVRYFLIVRSGKSLKRSIERWGVPPEITSQLLSGISFKSDARPPRRKLLWIIPWKRLSTAFGYAQAMMLLGLVISGMWGKGDADRTKFADAVDFIGWYNKHSYTTLRIRSQMQNRPTLRTMKVTKAMRIDPIVIRRGL